ncbi:transposase [Paenibacillus filicis]|uniref:Transposase n=1 Tax=Paenibacillus filicis TaxID=669464 RepID=A0ABU9DHN8_9BACL
MGRPSKYESHVLPKLNLVESWARDGLTLDQISHNLGIALSTFCDYKNQYSELSEALKNGKDDIDILVENALLKRAVGYEYEEVTKEPLYGPGGKMFRNDDGTPMIAVTKIVKKQVAPDTTAQIFWLKNRKPGAWRDKQDIEHSGTMTQEVKHDLRKLDKKELAALEQIIAKSADSG